MSPITSSRPGFVAVIACITTCFAVASVYSTQAVFSDIAIRYGVSASDARLAFSVSSIAYALAFFVLGPLSDLFGARRLAGMGLFVATVATLLSFMTENYTVFLVAMAVLGASAAAVPVAMFALMPRIARQDQIGTYFGLIIAASVVGITLGRSGMGLLTAAYGLGTGQLTSAAMLLVMATLTRTLPHETLETKRRASRLVYGEALRMLTAPALLRLFATGFLLFFGYLGVVTFLTLRLHEPPFLFDSATIGSISLLGLGAVLGAPLSGRLVGRIGSLAVGVIGLGIVISAIVCLAWAQSISGVGVGLFLIFLGVFCCQPAVFVRIAERVPRERRGAASSLYLLTCLGAGGLASAALGPVWASAGWTGITAVCAATTVFSLLVLLSDAGIRRKGVALNA